MAREQLKKILSVWFFLALIFAIALPIAIFSTFKTKAAESARYAMGSCVVNDPQETFSYLAKPKGVVIIICDTAKKVGLDDDVVNRIKKFPSSKNHPFVHVEETGEFQISTPFPDFFVKDYKNKKTQETWQNVAKTLEYVKNNAGNNSLVRYWMMDSIDKIEKALLGPIPISVTVGKDLSVTLEATDDLAACHDLKELTTEEEPDIQIKKQDENWSCTVRSGYPDGTFYKRPRHNSKAEFLIQSALNLARERNITDMAANLEVMLKRYQVTIPEEKSNGTLKIVAPQTLVIGNYANAYARKSKIPPNFIGIDSNKLSINYEININDEIARQAKGNPIGLYLIFSDEKNHSFLTNILPPSLELPTSGNFILDLSALSKDILDIGQHKLTLLLLSTNDSLGTLQNPLYKLEHYFKIAALDAVNPTVEFCITIRDKKVCFAEKDKGADGSNNGQQTSSATYYYPPVNYASNPTYYPNYSSNSANWFNLDETGSTYQFLNDTSGSSAGTSTTSSTTGTGTTSGQGEEKEYFYIVDNSNFVISPIIEEITIEDLAAIDRNYPSFVFGQDDFHWEGVSIPQEIFTFAEANKIENDDEEMALLAVQKIYRLIEQNPRDSYDKQYAVNSQNQIAQTINDYRNSPPAPSETSLSLSFDKNSIEPGMTATAKLTYKGTLPESNHTCHLYVATKPLEEGGGIEREDEWQQLGNTDLATCKRGWTQDWPTDRNLAKGTYSFKAKVLLNNTTLAAGPVKSSVIVADNALPNSEGTLTLAANPNVGEIKQGEKISFDVKFDSAAVDSYSSASDSPYSLKLYISGNAVQSDESAGFVEYFDNKVTKDKKDFTVNWQTTGSTKEGTHIIQATVYKNGYKINQTSLPLAVTADTGGGGGGSGGESGNVDPLVPNDLTGFVFKLVDLANPFNADTLVGRIVKFFSEAIGVLAFAAMLVGGFWYITSGGDMAKIEKGKKTMLYAIVAVAVYTLSFAAVSIAINILNGIF